MKDNGKVALLMTLTLSELFNGALQVKTPFLFLLFEYYTDGKSKFYGDATETTNMMGIIPFNKNSVTVKGLHG
ncbi:hypothetical protein [Psychrobacter sp. AOP7-A1-24]|uniref:hypothetical protein n=1 Tax=Psychrobacter sp. AOP7-A1-24 TaxID=3457646 RepID=UPI00402B4D92